MKIEATEFLPHARHEALITKEADGELLVYDEQRDRAHCLNETAAAVWRLCDGHTTVSEIAQAIASSQEAESRTQTADGDRRVIPDTRHLTPETRHQTPGSHLTPDTQIVWLALSQLRRSHLLEEQLLANDKTFLPPMLAGLANMSRREAVRRIGLGAAIALPLVASMTAPTAVEAAVSCGAKCHPCTSPIDCCNVCSNSSVTGCPSSTPRCT